MYLLIKSERATATEVYVAPTGINLGLPVRLLLCGLVDNVLSLTCVLIVTVRSRILLVIGVTRNEQENQPDDQTNAEREYLDGIDRQRIEVQCVDKKHLESGVEDDPARGADRHECCTDPKTLMGGVEDLKEAGDDHDHREDPNDQIHPRTQVENPAETIVGCSMKHEKYSLVGNHVPGGTLGIIITLML